ncbi:MAG TPA: hypothetical protein VFF04_07200 [Candidatus Babeliales bacterium]|nr:hypothetical protein [Candidatus Babeliales bacterium]
MTLKIIVNLMMFIVGLSATVYASDKNPRMVLWPDSQGKYHIGAFDCWWKRGCENIKSTKTMSGAIARKYIISKLLYKFVYVPHIENTSERPNIYQLTRKCSCSVKFAAYDRNCFTMGIDQYHIDSRGAALALAGTIVVGYGIKKLLESREKNEKSA